MRRQSSIHAAQEDDTLRICYLHKRPGDCSSDGAGQQWKVISAELRSRGHEILEEELGATHTLRAWLAYLFGSVRWLFRYPRLRADVLIAEDIESAFVGALARHLFGGAMVLTFTRDYFSRARGRGFRLRAASVWLMERIVPLWADLVIAGDCQKRHFVQSVGVPANRITCILPAVERSASKPEGEIGRGTLLFVGDLESYNRVRILVRALVLLKEKHGDLKLRLAGSGRAERNLRRLVRNLQIEDRVTFGVRSERDISELTRTAEIVLFTVADASNPRLHQALSSGKPVIISNQSSAKTALTDEEFPAECVLKVEPTPEGFARGISLLRAGPMAAEFFGQCGRQLVNKRSKPEKVAEDYEQVLLAAARGESLEAEPSQIAAGL